MTWRHPIDGDFRRLSRPTERTPCARLWASVREMGSGKLPDAGPCIKMAFMRTTSSRDPRLVTVRRGGTLTESEHRLLAEWAAVCAEHVLSFFERVHRDDPRPRRAIEQARAWAHGEITMTEARAAASAAHAAARTAKGAANHAARATGHAVAVAHMADHSLRAAAYALRAVRAAASPDVRDEAGLAEARWQRAQISEAIRELVFDGVVR